MKRLVPGIALALASAWGCSGGGGGGGVEIPTVEVGSGGARLMNGQPKSPAEAYDNAYSQLARAHYNVRRNLDSRGQNEFGAREAMKQILAALDAMRACVPEPDRARFTPYQERYAGWLKELETGTWGGSFLTDFDRTEREIKSKFSPATTEVIADAPPPPKAPAPAAPSPAKPAAPAAPENPEPAPAVSARAFFKAWSAAHDDLLAGYKEKKPCKPKYDDVIEALRAMKERLAGDKAARLQIYIDYYGGIEEKTKGFTALPEKTTEKDIVDELDVAARVIRKEFNPDK